VTDTGERRQWMHGLDLPQAEGLPCGCERAVPSGACLRNDAILVGSETGSGLASDP